MASLNSWLKIKTKPPHWDEYIQDLNDQHYASHSDWRLPTLEEAMSLIEPGENDHGLYINPLFNKTQTRIWTADLQNASIAWVVSFFSGVCLYYRDSFTFYVRAVR